MGRGQERSALEWRRYLRGLRRLGVTSVAEALLLLEAGSCWELLGAIQSRAWEPEGAIAGCKGRMMRMTNDET